MNEMWRSTLLPQIRVHPFEMAHALLNDITFHAPLPCRKVQTLRPKMRVQAKFTLFAIDIPKSYTKFPMWYALCMRNWKFFIDWLKYAAHLICSDRVFRKNLKWLGHKNCRYSPSENFKTDARARFFYFHHL